MLTHSVSVLGGRAAAVVRRVNSSAASVTITCRVDI